MCSHCLYPHVDSLLEKQQRYNIESPWENGPTNCVALCVWDMQFGVSKTKLSFLSITITSLTFQEKVCSECPEDLGHCICFDLTYITFLSLCLLYSPLLITWVCGQLLTIWTKYPCIAEAKYNSCPKSSTHIKLWKADSNKLCWLHWNEELNFSSLYWIIHLS